MTVDNWVEGGGGSLNLTENQVVLIVRTGKWGGGLSIMSDKPLSSHMVSNCPLAPSPVPLFL